MNCACSEEKLIVILETWSQEMAEGVVLFRTCHLTDSVCRCYSAIWNSLRPMSCS